MPPKRRRIKTAPVAPLGPNHQLNVLREQLDAQFKAETILEGTLDPRLQEPLERAIEERTAVIANILDEFLHDPFSRQPVSDFSNAEKYALRCLRAALVNELRQPSDINKTALQLANGSLVLLMRPEASDAAGGKDNWVPVKYRFKQAPRLHARTTLPVVRSRLPVTEGALEWRPRHMRDKVDQSLYELEDPNIKHRDPIDQETWDTIREQQPVKWDFSSTDDEPDKKEEKKRRRKEKKMKQSKKQRRKVPVQEDGIIKRDPDSEDDHDDDDDDDDEAGAGGAK